MTLASGGDAIEGLKMRGQSRKPLRAMGMTLAPNGEPCEKYVADFDVKAEIEEVAESAQIVPGASVDPKDDVVCASAIIYSFDDKPSSHVARGSAKHKTSHWHFSKRTAVVVQSAHEEIRNAIDKRRRKQISPG